MSLWPFTSLSTIVQGVLEPGRIEVAICPGRQEEVDTLQPDAPLLLNYCVTQTVGGEWLLRTEHKQTSARRVGGCFGSQNGFKSMDTSFVYLNRIVKPRSTSEFILGHHHGQNPSIPYASRAVLDVGRIDDL